MDYTAVGQTTHLAARVEQLATGGRSLITADTLRLAEGTSRSRRWPGAREGPRGPGRSRAGRGRSPPIPAVRGRHARPDPLVGRGAELEQLRQALGRAATGQGQVVAIVGEPGVGKSRLVWEVTHSHRVHGWLVLQAGSVSYGKATSYLPVVDLLKGYFALEDRDGPRAMRKSSRGSS